MLRSTPLLVAVLVATACSSPTTTILPTPASPTSTPLPQGITRLPLTITGQALPSPDGSMVAGAESHPVTVTIYTLAGKTLAQVNAPPNEVLGYLWLPDSSGLLFWPEDPTGAAAGPLSILTAQGPVQSTGLVMNALLDTAPSPDGTWLASLSYTTPSAPSSVEVAPRHGGAVRSLASGVGVRFLGWQGSNVIYTAAGSIYVIAPSGGEAHLLASEGGVNWGVPEGVGPVMSPDGQVLILFERYHDFARLVGTQVLPLPSPIVPPIIWSGPHQALGELGSNVASVDGEAVSVDMVSGALTHTGAKVPPSLQALSGNWVCAWAETAAGQPTTLHFTNLSTKREVDLGQPPNPGLIYSLGQGRFLLDARGQSYVLDPAAAAAS